MINTEESLNLEQNIMILTMPGQIKLGVDSGCGGIRGVTQSKWKNLNVELSELWPNILSYLQETAIQPKDRQKEIVINIQNGERKIMNSPPQEYF